MFYKRGNYKKSSSHSPIAIIQSGHILLGLITKIESDKWKPWKHIIPN